jgi:hypothetical protein
MNPVLAKIGIPIQGSATKLTPQTTNPTVAKFPQRIPGEVAHHLVLGP